MRRNLTKMLLAMGFSIWCNANAATPAVQIPLPCSDRTAFGETFGSTTVLGKMQLQGMYEVWVTPPTAMSPFDKLEVSLTAKSKRIWSVSAYAVVDSYESGRQLLLDFANRFEVKFPITDKQSTEEDKNIHVTLYTDTIGKPCHIDFENRFCSHEHGYEISLSFADNESGHFAVGVSCSVMELQAEHIREVMALK